MKTLFTLSVLGLPFFLGAQSQLGTGAVSGVVVDPSGRSVSAAIVHLDYNGYNSTAFNSVATTASTSLSTPVLLTPNTNFRIANNDGSQPDGTNARRIQVSLRFKF